MSHKFHRLAASEIDVFPYKRGVLLVRNHHHTHHGKSTCSNQYYSHYLPTVLQGSSSDDDESSEYVQNGNNVKPEGSNDDKLAKKVLGRKQRVKGGCNISLAVFASLFASSLNHLGCYAASCMILVSGVTFILKGASLNDRLKSDTYKQINMALGLYGLIGIMARGALQKSIVAQKNWTVLSFLIMVNSIKGYGYGLKGQELTKVNPVSDLVNGTKSYISHIIWCAIFCFYLLLVTKNLLLVTKNLLLVTKN